MCMFVSTEKGIAMATPCCFWFREWVVPTAMAHERDGFSIKNEENLLRCKPRPIKMQLHCMEVSHWCG